jgi:S-adenosylmethionine:tRNA ribosyltransferase-isomerase
MNEAKVLHIEEAESHVQLLESLPELALPGDVWIVNDAATFPASLHGETETGVPIELRLLPHDPREVRLWTAVLFGSGDWHSKTEERPVPPDLGVGDRLYFREGSAVVRKISPRSGRLVDIDFERDVVDAWSLIYRIGNPIQYSYADRPYSLWDVQTPFAGRPWAAEMPSAGRPLRWELLRRIRARGAEVGVLTHATGLSSTGDPSLDRMLPFPEFYDLPESTVRLIHLARKSGGRVIAVGTSVMRALESAARNEGGLTSGFGETPLKITADFRRKIVDGILSGIHSPGETHFELLRSFFPEKSFEIAQKLVESYALRPHEFGDSSFLVRLVGEVPLKT